MPKCSHEHIQNQSDSREFSFPASRESVNPHSPFIRALTDNVPIDFPGKIRTIARMNAQKTGPGMPIDCED
jgi:hypothetical protein